MSSTGFVLIIFRCAKPPFGFRWEVRRFAHGTALERATRSYVTEGEAREAGEAARLALDDRGA